MHPDRVVARSSFSNAAIRHLRDLLRSEILHGEYPDGLLRGEGEMMVAYGASRATVRGALTLLRDEGVIDRVQGVGTFVVAKPLQAHLLGTNFSTSASITNGRTERSDPRPRILDQSVVTIPGSIAERLEVGPGTECVRLEFVGLKGEQPASMITNYILFPEADRLFHVPFRGEWQGYLEEAGIAIGDADYLVGSLGADREIARILEVEPGAPLTLMEQLTRDPTGRPFNYAVMYFRGDRTMFNYRVSPAANVVPERND